jgi:hypothetical protein
MKIFLFSMVAIISYIFGMSFTQVFPEELENIYTNEKCDVSINYPEDWKVTESTFVSEKSKTIANLQTEEDDIFALDISIENYGLAKKSLHDISEFEQEFVLLYPDAKISESSITEINGFPAYKIAYVEGLLDEYELEEEKFHTVEYLVIAYDREYRLNYQAADKKEFEKYSPIVEQIVNTLKITKPSFEGINCVVKSPSKNSDQDLSTNKDNIVNIVSGDSNIQETAFPINVIDDIMRKHQQFAYTLGNPSSDIQITYDSQGYYQKFSKGVIYCHPQFGVHEVHGGISDKWENLGNENGTLGYPISDEYDNAVGRQSDFEKGHISWSEENGEITVVMSKE